MRFGIGIRWWLALAFALIAAVTAVFVASLFYSRSQSAFKSRAEVLVAGNSFVAIGALVDAVYRGEKLSKAVPEIADSRRLPLWIFDTKGHLLSPKVSYGVSLDAIHNRADVLSSALKGHRSISSSQKGTILVSRPLEYPLSGAMIAQASRPELADELGIVRDNVVEAALIAVGAGALVGLLVASLIAVRLKRISTAAAAIERGSFDTPLQARFHDEVGSLAEVVDRMRQRLQHSFGELEFERDRLRRLLERLHEGVVLVDRELRVEFANEEACRVLGVRELPEGAALPEPWLDFSLREFARRLFEPGAGTGQARVVPEEERLCVVLGIPASPEAENAIVVISEVSEQERREHVEREFVANAAHELRTPLTTILGAAEVLQSGAKDVPAERDHFLGLIERESKRLARLARALLVLARAQTREELPQLVPVELRPMLEEIADGLRPLPGVEIEVDCEPDVAALADPDLAEQALRNIAENAVKNTRRGRIVLRAHQNGAGVVAIEVSDTGRGMTSEHRQRIFDRFYRAQGRDAEGFGLGLAIVQQSVRILGGTLEVESEPGSGTVVRLELAAVPERSLV